MLFLESVGWVRAQVHHEPKPPDVAAKSPTEMPQMDVERQQKTGMMEVGVSENRGTPKWIYNGKPY